LDDIADGMRAGIHGGACAREEESVCCAYCNTLGRVRGLPTLRERWKANRGERKKRKARGEREKDFTAAGIRRPRNYVAAAKRTAGVDERTRARFSAAFETHESLRNACNIRHDALYCFRC